MSPLALGNSDWCFLEWFLWHFKVQMYNWLIKKIIATYTGWHTGGRYNKTLWKCALWCPYGMAAADKVPSRLPDFLQLMPFSFLLPTPPLPSLTLGSETGSVSHDICKCVYGADRKPVLCWGNINEKFMESMESNRKETANREQRRGTEKAWGKKREYDGEREEPMERTNLWVPI